KPFFGYIHKNKDFRINHVLTRRTITITIYRPLLLNWFMPFSHSPILFHSFPLLSTKNGSALFFPRNLLCTGNDCIYISPEKLEQSKTDYLQHSFSNNVFPVIRFVVKPWFLAARYMCLA